MSRIIFTFDCYGTLIDWFGGIRGKIRELYPETNDRVIDMFIGYWSEKDLEIVKKVYIPYRKVLRKGFKYALNQTNLPYNDEILENLVKSIKEWTPFPDTKENLMVLKEIGEIGIVSNTDREFIEASIANINVDFDHVIVAEDIRVYKPNPEVFRRAREIMNITVKDQWIHISSYPIYDIIPAKKMNVYSILLDRYGYRMQSTICYADEIYRDFSKLVEKMKKRFRMPR